MLVIVQITSKNSMKSLSFVTESRKLITNNESFYITLQPICIESEELEASSRAS